MLRQASVLSLKLEWDHPRKGEIDHRPTNFARDNVALEHQGSLSRMALLPSLCFRSHGSTLKPFTSSPVDSLHHLPSRSAP